MTRRDSRAALQKWFLDVDELLASQREHAISPSTVPSARAEQATWTTTLTALGHDLVELIDLLVVSPDAGSSFSMPAILAGAMCSCWCTRTARSSPKLLPTTSSKSLIA